MDHHPVHNNPLDMRFSCVYIVHHLRCCLFLALATTQEPRPMPPAPVDVDQTVVV